MELNNFAGRLYMDFEEYSLLAEGIKDRSSTKQREVSTTKAINFLVEWLCLRRKGQDIMHTPIRYVCQGRPLDSGHAFFVTQHEVEKSITKPSRTNEVVDSTLDEDVDDEDNWYTADEDHGV
jgi:hypothetical protein